MKLILCENYQEISKEAAKIVAKQLREKPDSILGLATGSTPLGLYNELVNMNQSGEVSFERATTFNLDEYYPMDASNSQSYRYFMNEKLFSKVNIDIEKTHVPDGMAFEPEMECRKYESMINECGGIDLQVLGIGQNGHIGFNEPEMKLVAKTHLTDLTQETINANARFFERPEDVPKKAITMGIGTILRAKKIILLASGTSKHKALSSVLAGDINTDVPASMLNLHPDVTVICDRNAYSCSRIGVDIGGTDIKFGVLDYSNRLIYKESIPTSFKTADKLIQAVADKCREIMQKYPISGVGVGTPGSVINKLVTAGNLPFKKTPVEQMLKDKLGIPIKVDNDANCAALGEAVCGEGKNVRNIVLVTLGTGVGGGIIVDGKIYSGKGNAGEVGHFSVDKNGKDCPCGEKGCWEHYASVTALTQSAISAATHHPDSVLYKIYKENGKLSGKLFFEALDKKCPVAKAVFDEYIENLAVGIKGIENIFAPDMIVLAGGITNAGDKLLKPLLKKVGKKTCLKISTLKNDAGICGAALLQ